MSKDLAHDKRVQAGLSMTTATLGLSALGTKGGAVAARQILRRAPKAAQTLRLTPKGTEMADKTSLGLVTGASGIGGASGYHYASLQRKEAKKEETSKSWDMKVKAADDRRAVVEGRKAHQAGLAAGRFHLVGQDPDPDFNRPSPLQRHLKAVPRPVAPPRRTSYGGIKLEDRRQRRMKGEQWGAAGVAGSSAAVALVPKGKISSMRTNLKEAKAASKKSRQLAAQSRAFASYEGNVRKPFRGNYKLQQKNVSSAQRAAGKKAVTHLKWAGKEATKIRPGTAALAVAAGAGAYGMHRMRRGQGRHYSDWWDG